MAIDSKLLHSAFGPGGPTCSCCNRGKGARGKGARRASRKASRAARRSAKAFALKDQG